MGGQSEDYNVMVSRIPVIARKVLWFVVCPIFTVTGLLFIAWAWDVHNDRRHTVTLNSRTTVLRDDGEQDCHDEGRQLARLDPGIRLHVRRIRYWKDCATVCVTLPDGREGYIVLDSSVSIIPSL
jgi:hypothetical protein